MCVAIPSKIISKEEFETKKRKLKDRQYEIDTLLKDYDEADDSFTNHMIKLINIANGALEGFRGSNNEQKRDLLNFIYQNLSLRGKKLEYSMRSPFSEFADCSNLQEWSE